MNKVDKFSRHSLYPISSCAMISFNQASDTHTSFSILPLHTHTHIHTHAHTNTLTHTCSAAHAACSYPPPSHTHTPTHAYPHTRTHTHTCTHTNTPTHKQDDWLAWCSSGVPLPGAVKSEASINVGGPRSRLHRLSGLLGSRKDVFRCIMCRAGQHHQTLAMTFRG